MGENENRVSPAVNPDGDRRFPRDVTPLNAEGERMAKDGYSVLDRRNPDSFSKERPGLARRQVRGVSGTIYDV